MTRSGDVVALGLLLAFTVTSAGCRLRDAGRQQDREAREDAADTAAASSVPQEFAEDLGIDLANMRRTPSGLYIEDLAKGRGLGARPGHVVYVHYTGWLPNGEMFDTSRDDGQPLSFQLGARQVIRGWEEGVQGMRIGDRRRLVIPPDLAYGARGYPGAIPPNATLVFEVELLDIKM